MENFSFTSIVGLSWQSVTQKMKSDLFSAFVRETNVSYAETIYFIIAKVEMAKKKSFSNETFVFPF